MAESSLCACGNHRRVGQRTCRECHAAYMRRTRPGYGALDGEAKRRANARSYARVYLVRGKLEPGPCESPGCKRPAQMHHDDYSRPLDVRWLCRLHHLDLHAAARAAL